jgi:hypothetical protein
MMRASTGSCAMSLRVRDTSTLMCDTGKTQQTIQILQTAISCSQQVLCNTHLSTSTVSATSHKKTGKGECGATERE